jgi:hypothetical protein
MKNLILVLIIIAALAIGGIGGYAYARVKYKALLWQKDTTIAQQQIAIKDQKMIAEENAKKAEEIRVSQKGYTLKRGKMMVEENGKLTAMATSAILTDGTKVMTTGQVVKKDGTKMTLKEGQVIWMDGTVTGTHSDNDTVTKETTK